MEFKINMFILIGLICIGCNKENVREYYNEEGLLIKEGYYDNGSLKHRYSVINDSIFHGDFKLFNENNILISDCNYFKGELQGTQKEFYDNGTIKKILNYDEGQMEGECFFYHENGKLEQSGFYKSNKPNGLFSYFDSNGVLIAKINWVNGKKFGEELNFHTNQTIKSYHFNYNDTIYYTREYSLEGKLLNELGSPIIKWELEEPIIKKGGTMRLKVLCAQPPQIEIEIIMGNVISKKDKKLDVPIYPKKLKDWLVFETRYDSIGIFDIGLLIFYKGENGKKEDIFTSFSFDDNLFITVK